MKRNFIVSIFALSLFAIPMFACLPALAQEPQSFFDVPATNPDYAVIENLKAIGVIQGRPDGTFGPDEQITRAEALKIILKVARYADPEAPFTTSFSDVPADSWYIGYVSQAEQLGIIRGNPDGTFEPNSPINTAGLLKILLAASKEEYAGADVGTLEFPVASDVAPDDWFASYLSYAKAVGIISPDLQNRLNPSHLLTRTECAEIIYKLNILRNGSIISDLSVLIEGHLIEALSRIDYTDREPAFEDSGEAAYYSRLLLRLNADADDFKAANDISAGLRALVMAYQAKSDGDPELLQAKVAEAETFADLAAALDGSRQALASEIHQRGDALLAQ